LSYSVPYVEAPETVIPGRPKYYATAALMGGYAQPVLGETHVGRPTKLEGNPDHPACLGATDAFTQAALLGLYDPDRSRSPRYMGRPTAWSGLDAALVSQAARLDATAGLGFCLLMGATSSPTIDRQLKTLAQRWPKARWYIHEPAGEERRFEATRLVFGRRLEPRLHLDRAEVLVSLDDDVLGPGPKQTYHARGWTQRRQAAQRGEGLCTIWMAEPTPSLTGVMAGRRAIVRPERIPGLVAALASRLGVSAETAPSLGEEERQWIEGAAAALEAHRGRCLVAVGHQHDTAVQALGLLINTKLGNIGTTLALAEPSLLQPDEAATFHDLVRRMEAGEVSSLAVLDCNPAYTAPADLDFAGAMKRVEMRFHAGLYFDETAALCQWHAPLQHELETWSDARAANGFATILQPLIGTTFGGRSRHAVLQNCLGDVFAEDRAVVAETWRAIWNEAFEDHWHSALVTGFIPDSAPPEITPQPVLETAPPVASTSGGEGLTVVVRPDPTVWDGRFANLAWLQELPKPLTKVTWDNVILVSPALAEELHIGTGDEVRLEASGRSVAGPAWVMPGQEPRTVTVFLGYGRGPMGRVMEGTGYDAYRIRAAAEPWRLGGARLARTGKTWPLASTQLHFALEGRDMVRFVTPGEAVAGGRNSAEPKAGEAHSETIYPVHAYESPSWGMSIDTDLCIGCNACVVACVAENNIPMVGKEQVAKGREMHWLRVDRYYEGPPEDPRTVFQPVPCMHCEKAPCEMGCPVNATTHSPDGLNQQVYNRCIGTRTCSSFCPYKVRRFNWFDLTGNDPPEIQALRNPDVTVRDRGVMEKCTYCVQRIRSAEIQAKIEGRPIRDEEVLTACQQACPTSAIVFGDVASSETAVSRRKASPRDYSLLAEVNTWPRTTYLARIEDEPSESGSGKG
jgi:molybdopterin-containing oxidoreductase family iron-sulfur binding subunit